MTEEEKRSWARPRPVKRSRSVKGSSAARTRGRPPIARARWRTRARDGGWAAPDVVVQNPITSRDERGVRCGPYEVRYDISHGYDAEEKIVSR